jgi:hypothetical protein
MLSLGTKSRTIFVVAVVACAAIFGVWLTIRSTQGESGERSAADALKTITAQGPDTVTVATVGGQAITRRAVDVTLALSVITGAMDASGKPLAGADKTAVLQGIVDSKLLALAGERAGIKVTDDEVTLMVNNSLVIPVRDHTYPRETVDALSAALTAMGTSLEKAPSDANLRETYREFLTIQRYVVSTGEPREALLARAKDAFVVQTFPERLAP